MDMTYSLTILTDSDYDAAAIVVLLKAADESFVLDVDGDGEAWSSVTLTSTVGCITLNRLVYTANGDRFSKLIGNMYTYFKGVDTPRSSVKRHLLERLDNISLAIGLVSECDWTKNTRISNFIESLLNATSGMLWDGNGLYDSDCRLILDASGRSEIQ